MYAWSAQSARTASLTRMDSDWVGLYDQYRLPGPAMNTPKLPSANTILSECSPTGAPTYIHISKLH